MNYFILLPSWTPISVKHRHERYKLQPLPHSSYISSLQASVNTAAHETIKQDVRITPKAPTTAYHSSNIKRYFSHFYQISKDEYIVAAKEHAMIYNAAHNDLILHFEYKIKDLNAFNFATYQ